MKKRCKWCNPDKPETCFLCRERAHDNWLNQMALRSFLLILAMVLIVIGVGTYYKG